MGSSDAAFAGSIPAIYEQYLGRLLFEPYAADLAARLGEMPKGRILEVAAGTGIVTRVMAKALPKNVEILATDLNQAMLDLAAKNLDAPNVTWRQTDAQTLPFDDESFDVVVCQFGVMFFPDKQAAYREALRVLKPGGLYLFNVWDRLDANQLSKVVSDVTGAAFPDDPPKFIERVPFGYFNHDTIRRALQDAGFGRIDIDVVEKISEAPSPLHPATGLTQGTPLRMEIEARGANRLEEITHKAEEALKARFGDGPIENRMSAIVVTAQR
ncbi:class I SAM-dependent methyltransferase [Microvirga sp. 2YAF29]|uniref:class I SAM-dependent methyltransferase n=1 Tax=Microvirga sp. 2YAF29 TaxID=3233031 RepID=UPI003F98D091